MPVMERLMPTTEVAQVNLPNGTVADVQMDPTLDPGPNWKTAASEPAITQAAYTHIHGYVYAKSVSATTPGGFATLATPANMLSTVPNTLPGEANYAAQPATFTQNVDYANLFLFDTMFDLVPDDATLTAMTVEVDQKASATSGVSYAMAMYSGGTLIGTEQALTVVNVTADTVFLWTPATRPTVAQLKAATFGVRLRIRRTVSQARTWTGDWMRIYLTYTVPARTGETRATSYRVAVENPSRGLNPVAGESKLRAWVRRRGAGATAASARLEVMQAGSSTVLATALANTPIESFIGQYIEGTFNPNVLSNLSGADLEVRVASDGQPGSLIEVGALDAYVGLDAGVDITEERLVPTSLVESDGTSGGTVGDIDDDPTAPDGVFLPGATHGAGSISPTYSTTDTLPVWYQAQNVQAPPSPDTAGGMTNMEAVLSPRDFDTVSTTTGDEPFDITKVAYANPAQGAGAGVLVNNFNVERIVGKGATIHSISMVAMIRSTAPPLSTTEVRWEAYPYWNGLAWGGRSPVTTVASATGIGRSVWQNWRVNLQQGTSATQFSKADAYLPDFGFVVKGYRLTATARQIYVNAMGIDITYTPAGAANPVSVRVGLADPSQALEPGRYSRVRAYVRKYGPGAASGDHPKARLEVLEAGSNTVLAIANPKTVEVTSETGQYIEAWFNNSVLSALAGTALEVRVATDGRVGAAGPEYVTSSTSTPLPAVGGVSIEVDSIDVMAGEPGGPVINYINGVGLSRANAMMRAAVSTLRGMRGVSIGRALVGGAGNRVKQSPALSHAPKSGQARATGNLLKGALGLSRSQSGADARANAMRMRDAAGISRTLSGADARAVVGKFLNAPALSVGRAGATGKPNAIMASSGASSGRTGITGTADVLGIVAAPALAVGRASVYARPAILLTSDGAVSRGASTSPGRAAAIATGPGRSQGAALAYGPGRKIVSSAAHGRSASGAQALADAFKVLAAPALSSGRAVAWAKPNTIAGARGTSTGRALGLGLGRILKHAPALSTGRASATGRVSKLLQANALAVGRVHSPVAAAKTASGQGRSQGADGSASRALGVRVQSSPALAGGRALSTSRGAAIMAPSGLIGGRAAAAAVAELTGMESAPGLAMGSSNVYGRAAAIITTSGSISRSVSVAVARARGDKNAPALSRSTGLMYAGGSGGGIKSGEGISTGRSASYGTALRLKSAPALALGTRISYGAAAPLKHAPSTIRTGAMARGASAPLKHAPGLVQARSSTTGRSSKYGNASGTITARSTVAGRPTNLIGGRANASANALATGRGAITAAPAGRSGGIAYVRAEAELMGLASSPGLSQGRANVYGRAAVTHAGRAVSAGRSNAIANAIRLVESRGVSRSHSVATGRGGLIRMVASALSMSMSLTTALAAVSKVAGAPALSAGKSNAQAWALGLKGMASLSPIRGRADSIAYPHRIKSAAGARSAPRANVYGRGQGVKDAPAVSRASSQGRARASKILFGSGLSASVSLVRGRANFITGNRGLVTGRAALTGRPSRLTGRGGRAGGRAIITGLPSISKPGIDAPGLVRGRADATARASVVRGGKGLTTSGSQTLALAHPLRAAPAISQGTARSTGRTHPIRGAGGISMAPGAAAVGRATYIASSPGSSIGFVIVVGPGDVIENVYPITIPGGNVSQRVGGDGVRSRVGGGSASLQTRVGADGVGSRITGGPGVIGGSRVRKPGRTSRLKQG